ncbi:MULTISPECIES: hypothetical protein [unclassified Xanthobacter]|uniref:hypothetical protein n=1 Tax=unclassified Xanthobacter TaxID=2623496 RepID=UPI001F2D7113|nr:MULTISPECIES: hypothetical protein [unclassified Xanthobacter]
MGADMGSSSGLPRGARFSEAIEEARRIAHAPERPVMLGPEDLPDGIAPSRPRMVGSAGRRATSLAVNQIIVMAQAVTSYVKVVELAADYVAALEVCLGFSNVPLTTETAARSLAADNEAAAALGRLVAGLAELGVITLKT